MSKTQKIILIIGTSLVGLSLVLLLVNTVLKNRNTKDMAIIDETNLFSLFERPITPNPKTIPEIIADEIVSDAGQEVENNNAVIKNYVLVAERPVFNFIPIEKTVDQISFSQDKKTPDTKIKKYGTRYVKYDGVIYEKYDGDVEQKVSNTFTARLGEVFLHSNSVVYRYSREDMQTIETYLGTVSTKEGGVGDVVGDYLPKNIRSFAINSNNAKFTGLLADESRQSAQIIIGTLGKSDRKTLLKTSFTDWLLDWLDDSNLVLTSRASGKVIGSAYIVNINNLAKTKIISDYGLTTKALPFGAGLIVSTVGDNKYETQIYQNKKLGYLPLKTVADKCTASAKNIIVCAVPNSPNGVLPDDWYRGEVNYRDTLISYNTETGLQKVLLNGDGFDIDIIKPSNDGSVIYFRNKLNGFLYKIKP
ncbi:hypothetical protein A3J61_00765 [Candidatus Nomurabacteria bacterium RIFCSPHIGHO2_02_FULL_38_15]|uniref:Uncharacterized protein n=1 Tax=Candidatus Nomurabacteria bacterium RIFCSPHIGHO2_02_FULL_38_15 TaxID=1801752 RepID=A0A1F6VQ67_9BACT|nr:MAG: hypothetical protein A3J61_00765 [Candidatus Nomurabacteria bacterium RIFCSPHIGHO2_02_FULL_38_15]